MKKTILTFNNQNFSKMKSIKIIVLLFTIVVVGCKKDIKNQSVNSNDHEGDEKIDIPAPPFYGNNPMPIVLGNQLQNPYTIQNMDLAVATLATNGIPSTNPINVRPTHEYIKFEPANTEELLELTKDESLTFYSYPLDYEILEEGSWYRDPEIHIDNQPTFHYASIKKGYPYNHNIRHTILSELYIPEEDETLIGTSNKDNLDYLDALLEQAYLQTGNEQAEKKKRWSWYTPAGNITIFDTRLNANIPLEGAKVTASRWFTTYNAIADANGNFSMGDQFKRPCDYKLWFARGGFTIGDNWLEPSVVIRNNIHGSWNHNIGLGYENMQGHMFRGAFRYYFQNIQGLRRPDRPNGNRTMIVAKNSTPNFGSGINYIVFPVLKVARFRSANVEYDSDEYFSTTCHELAHTTHVITMNAGAIQYSQLTNQIRESWPIAVEWLLTGLEYKSRGIANYGEWDYHPTSIAHPGVDLQYPNDRSYQYWNTTVDADYTSLFINLVDNINESTINYGTAMNPQPGITDPVANYTLSNIEDNVLKHSYGLTSLSQNLKSNRPTGVTDAQIDVLLANY